jgi:hypothetical protein
MHSARFSSGEHGNDELMRDLWQILFDGDADLVLAGHDHSYERFGPQDATGRANRERGLRSFVVGTGGKGTGLLQGARPNSEVRDNSSVGWLQLILRTSDYSWRFIAAGGLPLADSGSAACEPT